MLVKYWDKYTEMHGQQNVKISSTCFEQIIVHHQEVISAHAAYSTLSRIYGCLAANTMWLELYRCMVKEINDKKFSSRWLFSRIYISRCGPGSSVGVVNVYGLDGRGSNPGGGEIFLFISLVIFTYIYISRCGAGSSVGVVNDYGLDGPGSNPGGGEIFRTRPVRPCGPPNPLYNGYRVFPGGKVRPGRAADHSPPF